jgi:CheY-like chemotaxis protein
MARVLIVDDDDCIRGWLARLLRSRGYRADEAATWVQALDHLSRRPSDLLVVGVNLPAMEGWNACRQLRRRSDLPILMVSAMRPPFAWEGDGAGAIHAFIHKTEGFHGVLSWIRQAGGKRRRPLRTSRVAVAG